MSKDSETAVPSTGFTFKSNLPFNGSFAGGQPRTRRTANARATSAPFILKDSSAQDRIRAREKDEAEVEFEEAFEADTKENTPEEIASRKKVMPQNRPASAMNSPRPNAMPTPPPGQQALPPLSPIHAPPVTSSAVRTDVHEHTIPIVTPPLPATDQQSSTAPSVSGSTTEPQFDDVLQSMPERLQELVKCLPIDAQAFLVCLVGSNIEQKNRVQNLEVSIIELKNGLQVLANKQDHLANRIEESSEAYARDKQATEQREDNMRATLDRMNSLLSQLISTQSSSMPVPGQLSIDAKDVKQEDRPMEKPTVQFFNIDVQIYEDKDAMDSGNVVSTSSRTGEWFPERVRDVRSIRPNMLDFCDTHYTKDAREALHKGKDRDCCQLAKIRLHQAPAHAFDRWRKFSVDSAHKWDEMVKYRVLTSKEFEFEIEVAFVLGSTDPVQREADGRVKKRKVANAFEEDSVRMLAKGVFRADDF